MKNCGKCGSVIDENDIYCPRCGFKNADTEYNNEYNNETNSGIVNLSKEERPVQQDYNPYYSNEPMNTQQYTQNRVMPEEKSIDVLCLVGFILTFVFTFLGLNLISLIICIVGVVNFKPETKTGKGFGVAGIIINSVVMLLWIIVAIVLIAAIGYGVEMYPEYFSEFY